MSFSGFLGVLGSSVYVYDGVYGVSFLFGVVDLDDAGSYVWDCYVVEK